MNFKLLNKIFAAAVGVISAVVLFLTVQPSVSFWDTGEFIAASHFLQVPHPPGTPFFLLVGRIFAMIPFVENIALRVNTISVLTSAASIVFLYLIAVKLIENYRGKIYKNTFDALATYVAAAIGALSFAFSDTFWFNGVEAEVYAFSTFIFAGVTYLMMRWNERADNKDSEKYLLMIAYLIGLSTGVHLMSVLAIVPVVMVIMFRKYMDDEEATRKTGFIFMAHIGIILLIAIITWMGQTGAAPPSPDEYKAFDTRFKFIIVGISVVIMGVFWKKIFSKNSIYLPLIIGGFALFFTYPGIVKYLPALMVSVGNMFSSPGQDNIVMEVLVLVAIFAALGYGVKYSTDKNKPTLHLVFMSAIFTLIGFTTFAMVIIRANQNPPMNENEPDTFPELVSYLNREQYGDFPTFKRRFATEPHQMIVYNNYSSDFDFFWRYQMHHMMSRYWLWNYAGRESWDQDAPANIAPFNEIGKFFGKIISVDFKGGAKDSLFGIPLLIGLLGIYFHFRKDWKMAAVFMIMFILMGYLTAFYQNQQQPQPRERDYFYVGAFFVFSIWIALGVRGLADAALNRIKSPGTARAVAVGSLAVLFVLIPVRMLTANYHTHDRSGNWVPWDYSYNLLQSAAPNGILFTNGDNDTFPLWYLQDVEGVRRDVKVVNLSLLNTDWYIRQLKNNDPYNVGTVNIRIPDEQIAQLGPVQWQPQDVTLPFPGTQTEGRPADFAEQFSIQDSTILNQGALTFRMNNTLTFGDIKAVRVQDLMVREILQANNWQRPIYFAVTVSEDSKIGLSDYLKMEGMALRLVPEKRKQGVEFINEKVLRAQLFNSDPEASKDYQPGFKFRGLNNPDIFFDENHTRMMQNYRNAFIRLAIFYVNTNRKSDAAETLDLMNTKIPREVIPMDFGLQYEVGNIYFNAGALPQARAIFADVEKDAWERIEADPSDVASYYSPYKILMYIYEDTKEYNKLVDVWQRIQVYYPEDPNVKANIEKYKRLAGVDTNQIEADTSSR